MAPAPWFQPMKCALLALVLMSATIPLSGGNLLSPVWELYDVDDIADIAGSDGTKVNLLLSWERQGFCGLDGKCVIRNTFAVAENGDHQLEFSFPGDVRAVFINQTQVAGKVPNAFWTDRGRRTEVGIPRSLLKPNMENEILVAFDSLSYTGGISHSFFSIRSIEDQEAEELLSIDIPKQNHVYLAGDRKRLTVRYAGTAAHSLRVTIKDDFHQTWVDQVMETEEGRDAYILDLEEFELRPGFYECVVVGEGKSWCGAVEWFVVEPEAIHCSTEKPPSFDRYWKAALAELNSVDPGFSLSKEERLCSPTRDGYILEFESMGNVTIRGYYFVPKEDAPHPVILHLPGYTYGFEHLDGFIESEGPVAELALCVRGHGISKDDFDPWDSMTLWAVGICDRQEYVYRAMYMDCVRAVEFLLQRPEIDPARIGVAGGSQGGGLALATAGLCGSKIAACAVFDPWLCDFTHQVEIRTMVNKELQSFAEHPAIPCDTDQMMAVLDFVDTRYFAKDIECPVYFSTSLFDDDCPPHCGFSVFNSLQGDKTYVVYPNDSHLGESGQYGELGKFLEKMLVR